VCNLSLQGVSSLEFVELGPATADAEGGRLAHETHFCIQICPLLGAVKRMPVPNATVIGMNFSTDKREKSHSPCTSSPWGVTCWRRLPFVICWQRSRRACNQQCQKSRRQDGHHGAGEGASRQRANRQPELETGTAAHIPAAFRAYVTDSKYGRFVQPSPRGISTPTCQRPVPEWRGSPQIAREGVECSRLKQSIRVCPLRRDVGDRNLGRGYILVLRHGRVSSDFRVITRELSGAY